MQQRKILYMGLYLLIWGEAANVRFMPECLCYIFHNVSIFFLLDDSSNAVTAYFFLSVMNSACNLVNCNFNDKHSDGI